MIQKKQIFKQNVLKKLLTDDKNCVSLVSTTRLLALPPFFLNDMKSGILYLLNAMLKKYDRSLGGIVMGYQNIKVLMDENTGIIPIGTSEIEVNVSVEFYIFQPKIGRYLEGRKNLMWFVKVNVGKYNYNVLHCALFQNDPVSEYSQVLLVFAGVINKKSNNHIGCLVHQYFNATILKPDDINYDDWICKDFSIDGRVIFKVKDLDFTTSVPYIEGIVDEESSVNKTANCNVDNSLMNNADKSSEDEFLSSKHLVKGELSKKQNFEIGFSVSEKERNREEVSTTERSLYDSSGDLRSVNSLKKKKKKKEREKKALNFNDLNEGEEEKSSNDKVTSNSFNSESEMSLSTKKKKKKKKDHDRSSNQDSSTVVETSAKEESPLSFRSRVPSLKVEVENLNNSVKEIKTKKVKKKKREDSEPSDFNKRSLCLPAEIEDDLFYSTQIDPNSEPKKIQMPLFSPIAVDTVSEKKISKTATENPDLSVHVNNGSDSQEKKEKNKHKKRKREEKEESEGCSSPKKRKTSETSKDKAERNEINGTDPKPETKIYLEEMYKKLLNEAKEQLNVQDKFKSKLKKKKKESKKRERKSTHSEYSKVKSSTAQVNGSGEKSDVQSVLNTLLEKEIKRVKEDLNKADLKKGKSNKKKPDKKKEALQEKSKDGSSPRLKKVKTGDVNGEVKNVKTM